MYACETGSTTQGDKEKLLSFVRKILRKFHDPGQNQNGKYERRKNADLEQLYNKPNIRMCLKAKRVECADHVWRADGSLVRNALTRNPTKK